MPWIKQDVCTGCGICADECPVDAIHLTDGDRAEIIDAECIRCGRCHDVCPQDAVRHDGERIPQEVAENLRWVQKLLAHFQDPQEQGAFMQRMVRFFSKQRRVSEQTLAALAAIGEKPAGNLDTSIGKALAELARTSPADASKG